MTPTEFNSMDPALEGAVSEVRDNTPDAAVIEAAAARVWAKLAAQAVQPAEPSHSIRTCDEFQALLPELRAGTLTPGRATLVKDHLHECVGCRKVYEGKVVAMPGPTVARGISRPVRWATIVAALGAAAGIAVFIAVDQYGGRTGHALVQTVNGNLYAVSAAGIQPLLAGQELPDGVEFRTAQNSRAMLLLRDGSVVELRERSGFSTSQTASDLTIRLARGSVIVQAAKRRTGHLYVATADCRVAVTGTIFSVSSGIKGSRVSVVQGEVHVAQDNQDKILHPGDQTVTSPSMEPVSVKDDISWSQNRDRLIQQLEALRTGLQQIHLPALRYSSRLLSRLPASTVFFASIPNLAQYLGEAQVVFRQKMAESPELSAWWSSRGDHVQPVIETLRVASEYLGDEILIVGVGGSESTHGPVFLAEVKRDGFSEFLTKAVPGVTVISRPGLVAFGPVGPAVTALIESLDSPNGFQTTPFYSRLAASYNDGAGILVAADLSQMSGHALSGAASRVSSLAPGGRYFIAEQKEVNGQSKASAALDFNGPRTGIAALLAEPAPMGSLDYVSPEATLVTGFVMKNASAIVDQVLGAVSALPMVSRKTRSDVQQSSVDLRNEVAASLGGEFSLSLDGPPFPVPSWKLVAEVYDPNRLQASLLKMVGAHDLEASKDGSKPLRTAQEVVDGRTYYMIASGDGNPLTEVHYTFADGYLIAGPSRAVVSRALQMKLAGTSIAHSAQFIAMTPRDHFAHFSALIYENLGTTLAPLASLLGAFAPPGAGGGNGHGNPLQALGNMKPVMIAAYGEPDRITIAGAGDLSSGMSTLMGGNLLGAVPIGQFFGTPQRQPAYK